MAQLSDHLTKRSALITVKSHCVCREPAGQHVGLRGLSVFSSGQINVTIMAALTFATPKPPALRPLHALERQQVHRLTAWMAQRTACAQTAAPPLPSSNVLTSPQFPSIKWGQEKYLLQRAADGIK